MLTIFEEGINDISDLKAYIIQFKTIHTETDIDDIRYYGGKLKYSYSSINAISVKLPYDVIDIIKNLPNVKNVTETHAVSIDWKSNSNPNLVNHEYPYVSYQTDQIYPLAEVPWGISEVRAPEVHAQGNKGSQIKVCIIDTGIDYNHADLKNNYKGGYNFIKNNTDPKDDHGHGTHVAGTIAANGTIIGVAPEAYLFSCKVLDSSGSGNTDTIMAAIQWAIDNSMQTINMSVGTKDYTGNVYEEPFDTICKTAYESHNISLICSAGNNNKTERDTCGFPARYNPCIGIGNNKKDSTSNSSSSWGPAVEVSAPGTSIKSCKMGGGYTEMSGTSMAAPHVTGVSALVLKAHPSFTAQNVKGALCAGTIDLGDPGRDYTYGFGKIDAVKAVSITSPPAPPAYMSGKLCSSEKGTCAVYPVKADQCSDICDCKTGPYKWCCDPSDGDCGLERAPAPGCPGHKCFDGLMDCNDYCEGSTTCPNPTISFKLN